MRTVANLLLLSTALVRAAVLPSTDPHNVGRWVPFEPMWDEFNDEEQGLNLTKW